MNIIRNNYEGEKRMILSISFKRIQRALAITIISFSTLNFLDVATTLYTLKYVEGAFETNRFVSSLLSGGPGPTAAAVLIKVEIVLFLLLIYVYGRPFSLVGRILKIGTLAGLLAAMPLYIWGVGINNISILLNH